MTIKLSAGYHNSTNTLLQWFLWSCCYFLTSVRHLCAQWFSVFLLKSVWSRKRCIKLYTENTLLCLLIWHQAKGRRTQSRVDSKLCAWFNLPLGARRQHQMKAGGLVQLIFTLDRFNGAVSGDNRWKSHWSEPNAIRMGCACALPAKQEFTVEAQVSFSWPRLDAHTHSSAHPQTHM